MSTLTLVFVHGYSVTNLSTYGELPERLKNEAALRGILLSIEDIYLGRYISFNDEVRLSDVAKALHLAVREQIPKNSRFICITHSTGAPVVRTWLHLFYKDALSSPCPMSHLIMLAPANHGSALAQLGKSRLSRIKSWFDGVEPGQKILDWLELGSDEAWTLNKEWIRTEASELLAKNIFPFILSGQDIDRKLYDHLNAYTGEAGSDGVVRLASANLNSRYLKLQQSFPKLVNGHLAATNLELTEFYQAPSIALRVLTKRSHSGEKMGILKSVTKDPEEKSSRETVDAIFDCIAVDSLPDYSKLCERFVSQTQDIQNNSIIEIEKRSFNTSLFIHDRYAMVIFRLMDNDGHPVNNFDLILNSGPDNDPDNLPEGFFADRQRNHLNLNTLTYYFNFDIMMGSKAILHDGEVIRKEIPGMESIGLSVLPRPEEGFVRYLPCHIPASKELLHKILKPNSTTLVDIYLFRVLSKEVFRFEKEKEETIGSRDFKDTKSGDNFVA